MAAYDTLNFDPPAPLASVSLRGVEASNQTSVSMLIDSGADVTLVPHHAIQSLGLSISETRYELMGFDGGTSFAHVIPLELTFEGRKFRGQFLITQDDVGVLGRNVLNKVPLVLHGPHQEWYELKNES